MDSMMMSNEALWSILSGTSVVYSDSIVGRALEAGKDKFSKGILYYSNSAKDDKSTGQEDLPAAQKDFVAKIVKLIDVSEPVAWELFCCYLVGEFRGTHRSLAALLSSERHQQALLTSVWRFYHTERLYLLMGLRQIIARHGDPDHPYQELLARYMGLLDEDGALLTSLIDQLAWTVSAAAPSWRHHEALSSPAAQEAWVSSALKEQAELLQCLLTYCEQRRPPDRRQLLRLVSLFTRHGLGHSPPYVQLLTEQHRELVRSVCVLETVLFIHCLQLDTLTAAASGEAPVPAEHPLSAADGWRQLDADLSALGSRPEHGPLLLAWLLLLHAAGVGPPARLRTLTRQARQLDVLRYTRLMLTESEALQSRTSMIGKIARSAIYNMVNLLLLCFDVKNLGDEKDLITVCAEALSVPDLAAEFWRGGSGLALLLEDAAARFPAEAVPLLELCAALARAGGPSLDQVVSYLQRLPSYAEPAAFVPGGSAAVAQGGQLWSLRCERRPERRRPELVLPAGTEGRLLAGPGELVCWTVVHSGWQQALLFLDDLQREGELGEQHVQPETAERAGAVALLLRAVLETGRPELGRQLRPHVDLVFPILERHYRWGSPPQPFVHHAAEVLALFARVEPDYVWEHMDRNRLLPHGGAGDDPVQSVVAGRLGELIEAHECVERRYPLTEAFLHLLHNTVQAEPQADRAALAPAVAFVLRDVFPAHVRWQYARRGDETALGRACLRLFHALLTLERPGPLQQMVARALTDSPAADTLLTLVVHGEARIVMLLEEQTHWDTGAGLEFIRLIQVALSVLNRLLMLRCLTARTSPEPSLLERLLTSQPAGRNQLRPVLAVAQYLFHRHNPHLPTLAIRLMLRLAKVFPMSLLASFGQDSDVICSVILTRLRSETEDVNLKVAVLDFIATCVTSQPGLLQRLIGIGAIESEDGAKKKAEQDDEGGFLDEVLLILKEHSKNDNQSGDVPTEQWRSPLLLATAALVHALWDGQCVAALAFLTRSEHFWRHLTRPLLAAPERLPLPLAAHLLRTVALQLYYGRLPDRRLADVLSEVTADGSRLLNAWSQRVSDVVVHLTDDLNSSAVTLSGGQGEISEERQEEGASLLLAWRDWCLVVAAPGGTMSLSAAHQRRVLVDLMTSLERQLGADGRPRLVNILSELVMMLTSRWTQRCSDAEVLELTWSLLEACSASFEELHVRASTAILTTVLRSLQHCQTAPGVELSSACQLRCVPAACRLLELSLTHAEPADSPPAVVRLAGLAALLLRQLLAAEPARRLLAGRPTLPAALDALGRRLRQARQPQLCEWLLQAALAAAADGGEVARAAVYVGLSSVVCLPLAELRQKVGGEFTKEWRGVWVLTVHLWTALLRSQKHLFVTDALDFAAVHCGALSGAVAQLRTSLQPEDLEETEAVISFLATLMAYSQQWKKQHRHSFDTLLSWLKGCVGVCVWYVCRPTIVSLLLERPRTLAGREELKRVRRLSSTEPEPEKAPPQVTLVQNRLVRLSSVCLVALHALSPQLPELLTQDGLDLSPWERLVGVSFASPTLDKPGPPQLTYGTLLAAINVCVRPLARTERSSSPARGGESQMERAALLTLLHQTLTLALEQAALHQLRPPPPSDESPPLNRDHLHSELTSFLDSLRRQLRRGTSHSPVPSHHQEAAAPAEQRFLELVKHLASTVLK